jgi:hypothetical protein
MQKVVDIKFLNITYYPNPHSSNNTHTLANVLLLLEKQISEYLKNGWVMKGEITLTSNPYEHHPQCVIQTMVKYETTKVAELIEF